MMTRPHNRISLNVERRRIPPRSAQAPIILTKLPLSLLHDGWTERAASVLNARRPQRVRGPIVVTLTFAERRARGRFEELAARALDLLASRGLIDSSDPHTVRQLILCWGDVDGFDVRVEPVAAAVQSARSKGDAA